MFDDGIQRESGHALFRRSLTGAARKDAEKGHQRRTALSRRRAASTSTSNVNFARLGRGCLVASSVLLLVVIPLAGGRVHIAPALNLKHAVEEESLGQLGDGSRRRAERVLYAGERPPWARREGEPEALPEWVEEVSAMSVQLAEAARAERDAAWRSGAVGIRLRDDWRVSGVRGAAASAAIKVGDVVEEIDGVSVWGMTLDEAQPLLEGPPRTSVVLTICRGISKQKICIVRARPGAAEEEQKEASPTRSPLGRAPTRAPSPPAESSIRIACGVGVDLEEGLVVAGVSEDAQMAGVRIGDKVVSVDGIRVRSRVPRGLRVLEGFLVDMMCCHVAALLTPACDAFVIFVYPIQLFQHLSVMNPSYFFNPQTLFGPFLLLQPSTLNPQPFCP